MNFYNIDQNLGEKKFEGVFGMNCLYIYIYINFAFLKLTFLNLL